MSHLARRRPLHLALLSLAMLCAPGAIAPAGATAPDRIVLTERSSADLQWAELLASGHPDEIWRFRGLSAHRAGRDADAVAHFVRAARYADKYAQYYLGLMYWHGQGVARDPVQAYLWSDLAAERGGRRLLAFRERLWEALTPAQREEVAARGPALYAIYGDPAAKPRMELALLRFRASTTGSRLGYAGSPTNIGLGAQVPGAVGGSVAAEQFYAEARIRADAYWAAKQAELERGTGRIEVGQIEHGRTERPEPAEDDAAPKQAPGPAP